MLALIDDRRHRDLHDRVKMACFSVRRRQSASGQPQLLPGALLLPARALEPFRIANRYGLFAVMTTTRNEIIVEGSDDGVQWREYEFRYKPGDVRRRPPWNIPHQPRLDWQMWFAALDDAQRLPWFSRFLERLLEDEPSVTALLERNPFPDKPPRFIRAQFYDYHFTNVAERRATGAWWKREFVGEYLPPVSVHE